MMFLTALALSFSVFNGNVLHAAEAGADTHATATTSNPPAPEWEEVDRAPDLTLYRREIAGSGVLAYRGVGDVPVPMAKTVSIAVNTLRKHEWMNRIREAKIIKRLSPDERIEYLYLRLPWPLTDRDFLYQTKVEYDFPSRRVTIRFHSIDDPAQPEVSGRIRAQVFYATFVFTPLHEGRWTRVEAEAHVDPRGWIPKWVVNLYQKKLPKQTITGVIRQSAKFGIAPDARVVEMMKELKAESGAATTPAAEARKTAAAAAKAKTPARPGPTAASASASPVPAKK